MATQTIKPAQTIKRHPVRGALWGLLLGIGLALIGIGQGLFALGTLPPVFAIVAGIVIGILWSMFAPPKKPKESPPPPSAPDEPGPSDLEPAGEA